MAEQRKRTEHLEDTRSMEKFTGPSLINYDDRFKLYHLSDCFAWFTTGDPFEYCSTEKVGIGKDPIIPSGTQDEFMRIAYDVPYGIFFSECNTMQCVRGAGNWLESEDETKILWGKDISVSKFCGTVISRGGELWFPFGNQL